MNIHPYIENETWTRILDYASVIDLDLQFIVKDDDILDYASVIDLELHFIVNEGTAK